MSQAKINQLRQLASEGQFVGAIAAALVVSHSYVRKTAAKHDIKIKRATTGFWTDERVGILREFVVGKLSAEKCAQKLGHACTRNMCLAKARRMGLTFAGQVSDAEKSERSRKGNAVRNERRASMPRPEPKVRPKPTKVAASMRVILGPGHSPTIKAPTPFADRVEPAGKVTLLQLGAHHCKWPIGDPSADTFRFCGDQKMVGSYCSRHAKIAFVASKPRPPSTGPRVGRRAA